MRYLISLSLILICFCSFGQTTYPTGLPSPKADSGFNQTGYIRPMVLGHTVIGDTMIRPKYNGATRLWFNAGVDTAFWAWKDTRWVKVSSTSSGGGGGGNAVDTIYYRSGPAVDSFFYTKDGTEYLWYVNPAPDGVIYGGIVTWTGTGLDYFVTECYFRKNGIYYLTNDTTVTLPPLSDPDSSRTDVFVAQVVSDVQGQITTITGTESANPITPQINGATDLKLTDVTLIPGQTTGLTDTLIVYDNLSVGEFEYRSVTGSTGTFNNTTNVWRIPYSGDIGALNNNDIIGFGTETPRNALDYEGLSFFIKLKATMPNNNGMLVSLYSNGVPIGQEVGIPFNRTDLNYQGFSIPISSFQLSSAVFDSVRFRFTGGGAGLSSGLFIDFIFFQSGILQPATGVVQLVGDVTGSGQLGTPIVTTLESVITAGSCTSCNITYDANGRITVAANGSGGGITSLNTDVVATGPGAAVATIQPNVVTYAKMQQMVGLSVLGRATNTTGNMDAITPSAKSILITNMATTAWGNPDSSYFASGFHTLGYLSTIFQAMLNGTGYVKMSGTTSAYRSNAQLTSDVNTFTQTLSGAVPAPTTLNGYFLKDDGTWAAAGGGSNWQLGGNTGITAYSNYFGTTDSKSIWIRTNNTIRGIIDSVGRWGIGTSTPNASSILDITSTTAGLLIPRMTTTERNLIGTPATGLLIFNTTLGSYNYYTGTAWTSLTPALNYIASDSSYVTNVSGPGQNGTSTGTAGNGTTVVNKNIFIGPSVGISNTTGRSNIFMGNRVGLYNATASYCIAIGDSSLLSAHTSNYTIAIGASALRSFTGSSSISNFAIGGNALYLLTTGAGNFAMGQTALGALTTGNYNLANGFQAGLNQSGSSSIYIGYQAGINAENPNTQYDQSNSIIIGYRAGMGRRGGQANTFIGYQAGTGPSLTDNANNTGANNTAIGYTAMSNVTTGSASTAVGYGALGALTTGTNSTAVGYGALGNATTGSYNIGIGIGSDVPSATGNNQISFAGEWTGSVYRKLLLRNSSGAWMFNGSTSDQSISTGVKFDFISTDGGLRIPQHTTAQRNSISSPAANIAISNTELDITNDYNGTVWTVSDGTIFTQTADKNINTTAAETTLFGTGSGTLTIPASYLYSGNTITIKLQGYMTTDGTPTLDIKFKLGSTTITSTGATTLVSVASNGYFEATCTLTARASPGASAAIMGQGKVDYYSAATTMNSISAMSTATVNAATNGSLAVDATATFGTSHANNKIVITNAYVEVKN